MIFIYRLTLIRKRIFRLLIFSLGPHIENSTNIRAGFIGCSKPYVELDFCCDGRWFRHERSGKALRLFPLTSRDGTERISISHQGNWRLERSIGCDKRGDIWGIQLRYWLPRRAILFTFGLLQSCGSFLQEIQTIEWEGWCLNYMGYFSNWQKSFLGHPTLQHAAN